MLADKKKLLKNMEVRKVTIPSFDEIGVKNLYDKVVKMPGMAAYFPDKFPKGR